MMMPSLGILHHSPCASRLYVFEAYLFLTFGEPLVTIGTMVVLVAGSLSGFIDFGSVFGILAVTGTVGAVMTAFSYLFLERMGYSAAEVELLPLNSILITAFLLLLAKKRA